ncbi:hypothetical protein HY967_03720, partial [Candidatus Jorgensenbacteria bacterium]|nr:hypothetical protein [Candidatus Jorgensenbacteria bacterium]
MTTLRIKHFYVLAGASVIIGILAFNLSKAAPPLNTPASRFNIGNFAVEMKSDIRGGERNSVFSIYRGSDKIMQVDEFDLRKLLGDGRSWNSFEPLVSQNANIYFSALCPGGIWGYCNRGILFKFDVERKKAERTNESIH